MEFRLTYEGAISANADNFQKWTIRRQLEPQLGRLWNEIPLSDAKKYRDKNYKPDDCYVGVARHGRTYVPIVSSSLSLYAELDVLFLSSSKTGDLLHTGGDLDNRLKTLFDALTIPTEQ